MSNQIRSIDRRIVISRQRFFDGIPGYLGLISLVFSVIGAIFFPQTTMLLAATLAFYAALRFALAMVAFTRGLSYIKRAEKIDWHVLYEQNHATDSLNWADVHHLVIIPNYNEPIELLDQTLAHLAQSRQAGNMTVILAMEEREPGSQYKAETLVKTHENAFAHLFSTLHPAGLPGETRCKSANQRWAGRWAKRHLVDELGYDVDHIVVTTMDADTIWHPNYFCALTHYFATDKQRYRRFWQAPVRYHSNIYQINPIFRLSNVYADAMELAYLTAAWWPSLPISSYSLSLRLLDESGYWDGDVIADEWHMYIKAFFHKRAKLRVMPIYLPFLATAVNGETIWHVFRNRYTQTLRHAWGSKEIGYIVSRITPQTNLRKTLSLLTVTGHDLILSHAGWLLITLGSQLPVLLHPEILQTILSDLWAFPPFLLSQITLLLMAFLSIFCLVMVVRTFPTRENPATRQEISLMTLGMILMPLFAVLFVVIPVIHAQWQLLRGKQLAFQVTTKS